MHEAGASDKINVEGTRFFCNKNRQDLPKRRPDRPHLMRRICDFRSP